MEDEREEGLLEELQAAESRSSDHYTRHGSLAAQFGLTEYFTSFADSVEGEKEVLTRQPHEGVYQVAIRWDFRTVAGCAICKEAGFWVVSCQTEAGPRFVIPGTQYGRGRYPSQRYRNALSVRPDAIFAIWGLRTVCVLAFQSRDYDENLIRSKFQDSALVKAKDNLASLTQRSRDAVRTTLASHLRYPRFIRNPIRGLWYPPPRQRPRVADYANVTVPDFTIYNMQFRAYLDWLERSIQLENAEFVEALRAFNLDTGALYETRVVKLMQDGLIASDGALIRQSDKAVDILDEDDLVHAREVTSPDEEVRRLEDELQEIRRDEEERMIAEEERTREEEEEAAALLEEEEAWQREPSHEHCHYDEQSQGWVTEDGEPCTHVPDG